MTSQRDESLAVSNLATVGKNPGLKKKKKKLGNGFFAFFFFFFLMGGGAFWGFKG